MTYHHHAQHITHNASHITHHTRITLLHHAPHTTPSRTTPHAACTTYTHDTTTHNASTHHTTHHNTTKVNENLADTEQADWDHLYTPGNVYTADGGFVENPEAANLIVQSGFNERVGFLKDVGQKVDQVIEAEDLLALEQEQKDGVRVIAQQVEDLDLEATQQINTKPRF